MQRFSDDHVNIIYKIQGQYGGGFNLKGDAKSRPHIHVALVTSHIHVAMAAMPHVHRVVHTEGWVSLNEIEVSKPNGEKRHCKSQYIY